MRSPLTVVVGPGTRRISTDGARSLNQANTLSKPRAAAVRVPRNSSSVMDRLGPAVAPKAAVGPKVL